MEQEIEKMTARKPTPPRPRSQKKPLKVGSHVPTKVGMKLRKARHKAELSRERAVDAALLLLPSGYQFAYNTLTRMENGDIQEPSPEKVAALAIVYNVPLKEFGIDLRDEVRQLGALFSRVCAPWESNPEPADSYGPLELAV